VTSELSQDRTLTCAVHRSGILYGRLARNWPKIYSLSTPCMGSTLRSGGPCLASGSELLTSRKRDESNMPKLDPLLVFQPDNSSDSEVRQLKLTISVLRQALEEGTVARDELSRTIRAECDSEIAQLRQTITRLRDEVERSQDEHSQELRRLSATANDKAIQLQSTITALRAQLEDSAVQVMSQDQAAIAVAASEISELRATCQALRDELDRVRANARRGP
jgi:chromosome segregation ATPase